MVNTYSLRLIVTTALVLSTAAGLQPIATARHVMEAKVRKSVTRSVGLTFVATLAKSSVSRNEPITLKLSLVNNTKKDVVVVESNPLADYQIDVRDERGRSVPPTPEGKDLLFRSQWGGRRVSVTIAPGASKTDTFDVNKIYDMANPGAYTITAKRRALIQVGKPWMELRSNDVKVTVVRSG